MANGYVGKVLFVDLTTATLTEETRDGAYYRVYLVNRKGSLMRVDSSAGFFTIDRAGDALPAFPVQPILPLDHNCQFEHCHTPRTVDAM